MRRKLYYLAAAILGMVLATGAPGVAEAQRADCHGGASFERWLDGVRKDAMAAGISRNTLAAAAPFLTFDPGIVRRDRGQKVFQQSFLEFAGRMSTAASVRAPSG